MTPFEIADFLKETHVARYLFYKFTLPNLKIEPDKIDLEKNVPTLLNELKYIVDTFDQYWEEHIGKSLDGNHYHSTQNFSLWFSELLKKMVSQLITSCQNNLKNELAKIKETNPTNLFAISHVSQLSNQITMNSTAIEIFNNVVSGEISKEEFYREINPIQAGLPADILSMINLLKVYYEKSKKYSIQKVQIDNHPEAYTDNWSGSDDDRDNLDEIRPHLFG